MNLLAALLTVAFWFPAIGGELQRSSDVRTATIELSTGPKFVMYSAVHGLAVFEGDIVLGTVEELEASSARGPSTDAARITGTQFIWPDGIVPYTIDASLPDRARVADAIAHWEEKTTYRFTARTSEKDFVTFRPGTGCSSSVGRRGNQQFITLGLDCGTGNVIHEIGHTIGLWHEQAREDRDRYVRIDYKKVRPEAIHNFNQHVSDGDDIGPYDYLSIMHYPRNAYSVDGCDTVVPLDPNARIGQRDTLSAGDIAAANAISLREEVRVGGKRRAAGRG